MKGHNVFYLLFSLIIVSCGQGKNGQATSRGQVATVEEFHERVARALPGDTIVLANGVWQDAELLFEANGTEEKPIVLSVEEKGKVSLEGKSNLRIAGNHLVVEGLVFKNGFTPTNEVISFRKDSETLANNCRLTETVIDRYNNPERHETDTWVAIYGKNNRVDHNHLAGKNTKGVTMIVRLNSKESQENNHLIDHNYFGHRPNLGSNGGETLRIGTSHYSMTNSKTLVESNYFDRCNGEHEIISNKSNQNTYKYNTFYECTGTLTMRHGNETLVDGNVFIGNNKPSTGGIRVINGQQTVINNYGIGLTGYRFRGAFVIMNGVPNSPINRYFQVEDAKVANNTFIDCDHVQLCAGSDAERSAVPINSIVADNIFYNEKKDDVFTVYDDISGIDFENNIISPNIKPIAEGFVKKALDLKKNEMGLLVPADESLKVGAKISDKIATKENTGVSWYSKADWSVPLSSGKTIQVEAGLNSLFDAAKNSEPGDILELTSEGPYNNTKAIAVTHPLTVKGATGTKPVVLFEKKSLFDIENGGALRLEGLRFDGENAPDDNGNSVISTSKYSMNQNYKLFVENCDFVNLDVNHSFDVIRVYKNTFADTVSVKNSHFEAVTGNVMAFDKETDDIGIYNVEYVILKNNSFKNIGGAALRLYRGGTDESTFGPFLEIDHSVFDNVGHDKRNKYDAAISLYGVQEIDIKNNIFKDSKAINMHLVVGEPIVKIRNNALSNSEKLKVTGDQKYSVENQWQLPPKFSGKGDYSLSDDSPLKGKATDGSDLGLKHN
ncbi:polysaccharide lyase 6 family protein [Pseudozobellia thermophila]|nr:polysaccharide lyase 6 family protein [Pseudozobellia thermophila]